MAEARDDDLLDLFRSEPGISLLEGFEDGLLELPPMQEVWDGPVSGPGKGFEFLMGSRVHCLFLHPFFTSLHYISFLGSAVAAPPSYGTAGVEPLHGGSGEAVVTWGRNAEGNENSGFGD